jgi:thiol-disulfide isomerase/thioredoxin
MTRPSFRMCLFLLAAVSLPFESIAFVKTPSYRLAPTLAAGLVTKPLQMSDAAPEWYAPPNPPPLQVKLPRHAIPLVTRIDSEQAFQEYLQAPDDRITVVSFHAAWCKSCQKFGRLYQKLANDRADWVAGDAKRIRKIDKNKMSDDDILERGAVRLASIEWKANTELCRSLGVTRLPSVHYYQNGRKLAGFPAGPSKFPLVKDRLTYYQTLSKAELDFEANLEQGGRLISDVMGLAAEQQEQLSANDFVTASAAAATPSSSTSLSLSLTSTSISNRNSFINARRFKSLWPKIFRRKTQG